MNRCRYSFNRFRQPHPVWSDDISAPFLADDITTLHSLLPGYKPTPIFRLPVLAHVLGVKNILVKDESYRFDLSAFKVLGASYAVYRFLKNRWEAEHRTAFDLRDIMNGGPNHPWAGKFTLCTATDGNHGRAVAWIAQKLHQKAVIYMPHGTAPARIENILALGARVEIIDGSYDETVRRIAADAEQNGWQVISDTAFSGYMTIPGWIMAGYMTMFREMEPMVHGDSVPAIDFVFMQGGVGSFAAAGAWYYVHRYGERRPKLISVEPIQAACLMESIQTDGGRLSTSTGSFQTIMAGLNCGTPSHLAWPLLRDSFDLFMAITDDYATDAMRRYYYPLGDDPHIISGESGAAGLGALIALLKDKNLSEARKKIGLNSDSRILLFNIEGAIDPENFARIISERP
jgi:diaminopropionate ammonia-lyase